MLDHPEIYPMPTFPTLSVADVSASMDWYTNMMEFKAIFSPPGSGGGIAMAHIRWRKYADLLLVPDFSPTKVPQDRGAGVTFSFLVDRNPVDEMAEDLVRRGVDIVEGPVTRPWNTREVVVKDPDGIYPGLL